MQSHGACQSPVFEHFYRGEEIREMRSIAITKRVRSSYLCAGSSALMLAYAHIHTELWFLAFFALVPFLSQLCRATKRNAPLTGMILASVYVLATGSGEIAAAPLAFLFKFLLLNLVFGCLGLAITSIRSRLRFDPIVIALLTVPVSLILVRFVNLEHLFSVMHAGPNLAISFYSLFSILLWSAVIVLGSSLVLVFARSVLGGMRRLRRIRPQPGRRQFRHIDTVFYDSHWYSTSNPRAPPTACSLTAS